MVSASEKVKNAVKESCDESRNLVVIADWRSLDAIDGFCVFIAMVICGVEGPEYVLVMRVGEDITGSDGRRWSLKDGM